MSRVPTPKIEAGMTLGRDVKDKNGRILLRRGAELKENHIQMLKMWGVSAVDIDADGAQASEGSTRIIIDEETLKRAQEVADQLFWHTDMTDPVIKKLYELGVEQIACREVSKSKNGT